MVSKITYVAGIIVVMVLVWAVVPHERDRNVNSSLSVPDYSVHPIYSGYDFSRSDTVINIGLQPLYLPANWIFEVVRRDIILRESLAELGMSVQFFSFLKGADVNHYLRRGDLDAGIGGDMAALTIAATHNVVIPIMVQHGFTSIVASKPMLVSELRGKRIGFAYGSNAHFTVLDALASQGLTGGDVDFVSMETTDMPGALQSGRIDAFSSWEPTPTITEARLPASAVIHRGHSTGYLYFSRAFSDRYPEAVRHILAAEVRALRWMQSDPENLASACKWACRASELLADTYPECPKDKRVALAEADLLGSKTPPFIPASDLLESGSLYREFMFLSGIGAIPEASEWETVKQSFNQDILEDVLSKPYKYRLHTPLYAVERMTE